LIHKYGCGRYDPGTRTSACFLIGNQQKREFDLGKRKLNWEQQNQFEISRRTKKEPLKYTYPMTDHKSGDSTVKSERHKSHSVRRKKKKKKKKKKKGEKVSRETVHGNHHTITE
jgi:hypothetical protein